MIRQNIARIALLATILLVAPSSPVVAAQSTDRTILKFSAPVKIPGATLPPGTYVFELVNPTTSMDVVKVTDEDGSKVYALMQAVPTIRPEPAEDVVLLFTPMDNGSAPAIRGWYPPGRSQGHLFVYSNEEARSLADRGKSVVLSRDSQDSNMQRGTIVLVRPEDATSVWMENETDENTAPGWQMSIVHDRESITPMVVDAPRGQQVSAAEIEDHPEKYVGKSLSVDGKVDEIYGTHLFELDEPDWGQPEGDVLVFLPEESLEALREGDRVTVTGTLERFNFELAHKARWVDVEGVLNRGIDGGTVLIATRIVGGDNERVIVRRKLN